MFGTPTACVILFIAHKIDKEAQIVLRDQSWVTLATFIGTRIWCIVSALSYSQPFSGKDPFGTRACRQYRGYRRPENTVLIRSRRTIYVFDIGSSRAMHLALQPERQQI